MWFLGPIMAATPTPGPAVDLDDPWVVSPGIEGFILIAVLGIALWLLVMSMTRHIRKANHRASEREEELYGPTPGALRAADAAEPDSADSVRKGDGTAG
ncbi:MAG TPA: hypothetical protein VFC82_00060 [Actinomycetaceae bacterium]|nr:hypothetical protein [Actinomycetaceae bacterium]